MFVGLSGFVDVQNRLEYYIGGEIPTKTRIFINKL